MSKPFDATVKELITSYPADWLAQLGVPVTDPPEVLSAELSTVSAAADTLIKVGNLVVHIDLKAARTTSWRAACCCTMCWRTTTRSCRYGRSWC